MSRIRETGLLTCDSLRRKCIIKIDRSLDGNQHADEVMSCVQKYKPPTCTQDGGKKSRRNTKQKKGGKSKRRSNGRRNKTFKKMRGGGG
jgi:hypothetical protein